MAVTTEDNRTAELTTDGVVTDFDFDMLIHAASEVQVWYKATGGSYTELTLETDYGVTSFTEDGGTVSTNGYTAPLAAGALLIIRHLELTMQTNWLYLDNHSETQHQDDFDRCVMRDLQMQEQLDRAVGFAIHSSTSGIEFPEPASDQMIGWNTAATALENKTAESALTVSDYGKTLIDDADAVTARTTLGLGTIATFAGDQDLQQADSPTFTGITATGAGSIGRGLVVHAEHPSPGDTQEQLTIEGYAGAGSARGGSIEWYNSEAVVAGYTFANTSNQFVWKDSAQNSAADTGVAWVDMDTGEASFRNLIINEGGGDYDTRIEGDTEQNLFFVDASTDRIGVGTNSPINAFHVNGIIRSDVKINIFPSHDALSGQEKALNAISTIQPAGESSAEFIGTISRSIINTDVNLTGSVKGARYQIDMTSEYTSTVDEATLLDCLYVGDADFTGTLTDAYGLRIRGMDFSDAASLGSGTVTNAYGLKIEDVEDADTLNYAIYTGTGAIRFGDKVMFTQTDGNEYIDSLNDGYMDYGATTGHRFDANVDITGTINTTSDDNWDLNDYTADADHVAAGYVTVTINGTSYRLLAYPTP